MKIKKVTYKELGRFLNPEKKEATIKSWKKDQPDLLELCMLGALCRKNKIDYVKLSKIITKYQSENLN